MKGICWSWRKIIFGSMVEITGPKSTGEVEGDIEFSIKFVWAGKTTEGWVNVDSSKIATFEFELFKRIDWEGGDCFWVLYRGGFVALIGGFTFKLTEEIGIVFEEVSFCSCCWKNEWVDFSGREFNSIEGLLSSEPEWRCNIICASWVSL